MQNVLLTLLFRYVKIDIMKIFLLSLVIVVFIAGSTAFPLCSQGDLNGDCKVDWEDIKAFAEQWLDDSGSPAGQSKNPPHPSASLPEQKPF